MILVVMARCTSDRSKTPASAAYWAWSTIWSSRSPSSSARSGRGAALERVVDLVRLLQQERPQRQVVLLAVPGAAVGRAQAVDEPGEPERAGRRCERVGQWRQQVRRRRPARPRQRRRPVPSPVEARAPGGRAGRGAAAARPGRRRGRGGRAGSARVDAAGCRRAARRGGQRAGAPRRGRRAGRPGGRGRRPAGRRPGRRQRGSAAPSTAGSASGRSRRRGHGGVGRAGRLGAAQAAVLLQLGDDQARRWPRASCRSCAASAPGRSGGSYGSSTPVNSVTSPARALAYQPLTSRASHDLERRVHEDLHERAAGRADHGAHLVARRRGRGSPGPPRRGRRGGRPRRPRSRRAGRWCRGPRGEAEALARGACARRHRRGR